MDHRKQKQLPMLGVASSNIRRQLKRLKDLHLIETNANLYRISEWNNMTEIFEEKIHNFLLQSVISRVKDYVEKIDQEFSVVKEEESVNGQKNLFETPVKED